MSSLWYVLVCLLLIALECFHMFVPIVQQEAAQKGERLARARLLLDAVERKIACERGREVLREFLRTLMRNRHLRFLGEELALAANIVQGKCACLMEVLVMCASNAGTQRQTVVVADMIKENKKCCNTI